jgi:nitrogen fixation NifU-like protein
MDLYADQILDHYKHPRHAMPIGGATCEHEEVNLSCGDRVRLQLMIEDGIIRNVGWHGDGCAISQAGMSLLSEKLMGMPIDDALKLTKDDVLALLGVPMSERRLKCALLGLHTLLNTLRLQKALLPQSWSETVAPTPSA